MTIKLRPTKDEYYLNIAEQVALRSTCLRRNFGAVIVNHDQIVATGYGGAPRNTPNCNVVGFCYRGELGARRGEHYEFCRAVHAEQNAMIQASRLQMLGGVLYLVGLDARTKEPLNETEPCRICKRLIINAGIRQVIARRGEGQIENYSVEEWVKNYLWELYEDEGRFMPMEPPRTIIDPIDKGRADQLISRFSLADAVIVQTGHYEDARRTIGRAAARYFTSNVRSHDSVALSCGDTLLCMLESLPYQPKLQLTIRQLSIEADPTMIHQAPATLAGLLRAKCSPQSEVFGLQLPPLDLTASSLALRQELVENELFADLRRKARHTAYVFVGVGSAGQDSSSFWAMAQAATDGEYPRFVKKLGIVGEINNQVFDRSGTDCTARVPGLHKHVINILSLQDIKEMASDSRNHKVIMVATGEAKTEAMRSALVGGVGNVVITGRADADRLLAD